MLWARGMTYFTTDFQIVIYYSWTPNSDLSLKNSLPELICFLNMSHNMRKPVYAIY